MRMSDWSSDVCSSDLAVIPSDRLEPEFVELVLGNDEARRCGVILLARIAGGDDAAFERAQLAERFQRRVGTIALVVPATCRIVMEDDVATAGDGLPISAAVPDDLAAILYTSGPTGRPTIGRASGREIGCRYW